MGFLHKLHIIYLINDVLHNAARKATQNVQSQLQTVIVPIYCHTIVGESQENQQRCEKVVWIWETNNCFDNDVIEVRCRFQSSFGAYSTSIYCTSIMLQPVGCMYHSELHGYTRKNAQLVTNLQQTC